MPVIKARRVDLVAQSVPLLQPSHPVGRDCQLIALIEDFTRVNVSLRPLNAV
jgi:hypothetical protein